MTVIYDSAQAEKKRPRYAVESRLSRKLYATSYDDWRPFSYHRSKLWAIWTAADWARFGHFEYRVVDTRPQDSGSER